MNVLPEPKTQELLALFMAGYSIRSGAQKAGVSHNTARRYYPYTEAPKCPCGRLGTHNGWCWARYAESPRRQAMLGNKPETIADRLRTKLSNRRLLPSGSLRCNRCGAAHAGEIMPAEKKAVEMIRRSGLELCGTCQRLLAFRGSVDRLLIADLKTERSAMMRGNESTLWRSP